MRFLIWPLAHNVLATCEPAPLLGGLPEGAEATVAQVDLL